jgi:phage-related protein
MADEPKPIVWMGSSRRDLKTFPKQVRSDIGQALYAAQMGETDPAAKPLKGFGGARLMEIIDRHDTNTYRAVYTVQFSNVIYVLHPSRRNPRAALRPRRRTLNSSAADSWKLSGLTGKGAINNGD